jgi:hypothetical protein
MTTLKTILPILALSIFAGCSVSADHFPEPGKLKSEIAKSIEVPFQGGDTLIYDSFIGVCGNSSEEELNRYYEPHLDEQPYFDILKLNTHKTTLCLDDSLYALMDRLCKDNSQSVSVWDCFSKNKIVLSITGEAVTNRSVKIHENYSFNGDIAVVEKLFEYTNDKWTFKIVDNKEVSRN